MAELSAPAHLIETRRRKGTDQRKAGDYGEDKREQIVIEGEPGDEEARERVDDADEEHIGPAGAEIAHPLLESVAEI